MNAWACLLIIPAVIALLGLAPRLARILPGLAAGLMLAQLVVVFEVCRPAFYRAESGVGDIGIGGVTAAFLLITTVVAAAAFFQAAFLLPAERAESMEGTGEHRITERRLCFFYTLAASFLGAMYAVLLAHNLGYMWIAMEATTLLSAPLVYYHRSRRSLEATWKYLLLCSVGIAFALFGTVLLIAAQHADGESATLLFGRLLANARGLDARLVRLGFVFCVLGYGVKAGLFPLHNWLPDAHSEAPAPASAMLSGALLNCALVAIWRVAQVTEAAGQGHLVRQVLVPAGAITVAAAALMLLRQHDLKRMWAYSSVEHVGLLTLAIGIGATPVFILHALNHSLVKVALFLLSGSILHVYGTKSLAKLRGLLSASPVWGLALFAATFAIAGSPPFGTFLSEWLLLSGTIASGERAAAALVIAGLTVTFVALSIHAARVLFGEAPAMKKPRASWALAPAVLLAASLATGLALVAPAMAFLATLSIGGRP